MHNVRTVSAEHITRDICLFHRDIVRTLCGHISPGIYVRNYILLRFSPQVSKTVKMFKSVEGAVDCTGQLGT